MQKQDFYGLPRSIQDRFIEASQGASAPLPLGFIPERQNGGLGWGMSALISAGLWAAFTMYGLGRLDSPFAISTLIHRLVHIAFALLSTFLALQAYARSWANSKMPYLAGTYLFPGVIIEASFGQLLSREVNSISRVETSGTNLVLKVGSSTLRFPCGSVDFAAIAAEKVAVGIERWKASEPSDHLERARLSPLVDSGIQNPLAPTAAHERPTFLGVPVLAVLSVVIGIAAGYGVAVWRDTLSQKALYRAAISANTIEAYRAYISRGGIRPEVKRLLLPRAELNLAISKGSVEAIETFVGQNQDTEIAGEVQNALRAALLVELEAAKKLGTLKAVTDLANRFKEHQLIDAELSTLRHEIYVSALDKFRTKAAGRDPDLVSFVEQAIGYAETHGPTVHLRVSQDFSQEAESLDQIVIKSHEYYMGVKGHPSQYALGARARAREQKLFDAVIAKLQPEFSEEILKFVPQPLPQAANEELPAAVSPTLTFIHKEKLSGGYVGGKPKAMYLGVAITLTALAELPGAEAPVARYDWSAWRNPEFSILVDPKNDFPEVYEGMIGGAFAIFTDKYLARWF
jgi:hypothetical protein